MKLQTSFLVQVPGQSNEVYNHKPGGYRAKATVRQLVEVKDVIELLETIREAGSLLTHAPGVPLKDKVPLTHKMTLQLNKWGKVG